MANSSKKRKASELDSEPSGRKHRQKLKNKSRAKSAKYESKGGDDLPFKTECPYKPSGKSNDDVFVQREELAPGFVFDFGVRPGMEWNSMRSYRNVKLQDHTFSAGTVVYINKQTPPPKALRAGATDAEILKYDRSNFWVGRIADTRAESDKAVFVRLFWLYWPEELPMGRQPYHSDRELIMSNAMDIVDATTISGAADLKRWDEKDPPPDLEPKDRFWRQTFDISQLGKDRKGGLSELRKHCRCHQPCNPDKAMFRCKDADCSTWNHEACVIDDIMAKLWPVYEQQGTLDGVEVNTIKVEDSGEGSGLGHRLLSPIRQLGKSVQSKMTPSINAVIDQALPHQTASAVKNGPSTPKMSKSRKSTTPNGSALQPWESKLVARLITSDEGDGNSSVVAQVEETSKKKAGPKRQRWLVPVNCLRCDKELHPEPQT